MTTSLIQVLANEIPTLPPRAAALAAHLIAELNGLGANLAGVDAPTAAPDKAASERGKVNAEYARKGKKLVFWTDKVLTALATPATRAELTDRIKAAHGKCLPPYACSYLLHFLWSRQQVEEFAEPNQLGRTVYKWRRVGDSASGSTTDTPVETPKAARKRLALRTKADALNWVWERLGETPKGYAPKAQLMQELRAAGVDTTDTELYIAGLGITWGRERVEYVSVRPANQDLVGYWARSVDEHGKRLQLLTSGAVLADDNDPEKPAESC